MMPSKITLLHDDVTYAMRFAEEFASGGKSNFNYGNATHVRSAGQLNQNALSGKLGELAFGEFAERFGLKIEYDDEIREGRNAGDLGNDVVAIEIYGERRFLVPSLDVKCTKPYSKWLLVEEHQLRSSIYVLSKASIDIDDLEKAYDSTWPECFDRPRKPIEVEMVGWAFHGDFFNAPGDPKYFYKRGDYLGDTNTQLSAPNFGLPVDELRQDWQDLFQTMKATSRISKYQPNGMVLRHGRYDHEESWLP